MINFINFTQLWFLKDDKLTLILLLLRFKFSEIPNLIIQYIFSNNKNNAFMNKIINYSELIIDKGSVFIILNNGII